LLHLFKHLEFKTEHRDPNFVNLYILLQIHIISFNTENNLNYIYIYIYIHTHKVLAVNIIQIPRELTIYSMCHYNTKTYNLHTKFYDAFVCSITSTKNYTIPWKNMKISKTDNLHGIWAPDILYKFYDITHFPYFELSDITWTYHFMFSPIYIYA